MMILYIRKNKKISLGSALGDAFDEQLDRKWQRRMSKERENIINNWYNESHGRHDIYKY